MPMIYKRILGQPFDVINKKEGLHTGSQRFDNTIPYSDTAGKFLCRLTRTKG